jgi:hypothetical protein
MVNSRAGAVGVSGEISAASLSAHKRMEGWLGMT